MQGLQVEGVYRQGMAPASASPHPPSGRSDIAGSEGQGSEADRRGGIGALRSQAARRGDRDPDENAEARYEPYGPLDIERHAKEDGRALILYARRERRDE
jgi:hypothetical protein